MKIWMLNASLEDWEATRDYCGFGSEQERSPISAGDRIIYFCNGLIVGVFEAGKTVESEFSGLKERQFQVKLRKILVPENGLVASPLHYRTRLQPHAPLSPSLWGVSAREYEKIMQALAEGKKELVF